RALLTDGDVDAADLLVRVAAVPVRLLVEDRVDGDGRLAGAAVADDQLPLAAADGDHRVDRLDAGLERLVDALTGHDAGRLELQGAGALGLDRAEPVDRLAGRVDDPAEEVVAHGGGEHLAGPVDRLALLDAGVLTEHDDTDVAHVEVEREAQGAVLEAEQLVRHRPGQALDARDAVTGDGDATDLLAHRLGRLVGVDEAVQRRPDLLGLDRQLGHCSSFSLATRWSRFVSGAGSGSAGEPASGVLEAGERRAVDDLGADLDPHPTDHRGVDPDVDLDGAAVGPLEDPGETGLLRLG